MDLSNITYQGPEYQADQEIESLLPDNLLSLLKQINGFIQFGGGLHVRGLCNEPEWHSLRAALFGENAIHKLYPLVEKSDVPFAQDCVADQYLLRDRTVHKLFAETGELESLEFACRSVNRREAIYRRSMRHIYQQRPVQPRLDVRYPTWA